MFARQNEGLASFAAHTCFLISIALCASESLSCRAAKPCLSTPNWNADIHLEIFTFRST
jgi:hypothetical protein